MTGDLLIAFDSKCWVCQRFAKLLADASGGRVRPVALATPETRDMLARVYPRGFKDQPYLITRRGERVRAATGLRLVLQVRSLLGWRRSWQLFQEMRAIARKSGQWAA